MINFREEYSTTFLKQVQRGPVFYWCVGLFLAGRYSVSQTRSAKTVKQMAPGTEYV